MIMSLLTSREQQKLLRDSSFATYFREEIKLYKDTSRFLFGRPDGDTDTGFAYQCVKNWFKFDMDVFTSAALMRSNNFEIIKKMLTRVINNTFFDRLEI